MKQTTTDYTVEDYIYIRVKSSWTFEKLTEVEQEELLSILRSTDPRGTKYQRTCVFEQVKKAYLAGLGYYREGPANWRA